MPPAFVILQAADIMLPSLGVPAWALSFLVIVVILGFPIALVLAWALELTPDGVKVTRPSNAAPTDEPPPSLLGKRTVFAAALLVAVGIGIGAGWFLRPVSGPDTSPAGQSQQVASPDVSAETSIAVLPFVNMSADPEQGYFSDGMTEEIINALVKVDDLAVVARTSVFAFKDHSEDVREIGRRLGVTHVLEGSVRSQGEQVRITAQLINVETGFHHWSETFDRRLADVFAIQDEIANAIAGRLAGRDAARIDAVPQRTADLDAYDLFLQGRAHLRRRELEPAWRWLHEATAKDPGFAPAWASLAISYQSVGRNEEAEAAAQSALAIDPRNGEALTAMAGVYRDRNDWFRAEALFEEVLALDPRSSETLEDYAEFLGAVAHFERMLEVSSRGFQLDPLLAPMRDIHISALILNGRLQEALDLAMDPEANPAWAGPRAVQILMMRGQVELAIREVERTARRTSWEILGVIELLRDPSDAAAREAVLRGLTEAQWLAHRLHWVALSHAGENRVLLERYLEVARAGSNSHEWSWMPELAAIRSLPEFVELVQAYGLPEYWSARGWPEFCRPGGETGIECD
jgi:TolB-like protein